MLHASVPIPAPIPVPSDRLAMTTSLLDPIRFSQLCDFARDKPTPFLLLDPACVEARYRELRHHLPAAAVYYAVKACPHPAVLERLAQLGACFDIASRFELDQLLALDVSADRLSFGNTIKKSADIAYAYAKGVRMFASDSVDDVDKLARHAPGSRVYVRLLASGSTGAAWPLTRKFGCDPELALTLLLRARERGLDAAGVSFHVGSQQREAAAWEAAIAGARLVFDRAAAAGLTLRMLNIGGGFPARYSADDPPLSDCLQAVARQLADHFPDLPELLIEPGRVLVAEAGAIVTEVVLVARKAAGAPRWVYVDAGLFGGLIETLHETIRFSVRTERAGAEEPAYLAGPTCDSLDILYERQPYPLPLSLREGDRLYWLCTGAYSASYSAVAFNGFPPLATYVLEPVRG